MLREIKEQPAAAARRLEETCYVIAEALSAADLLYGPIAAVERDFPVMLFAAAGRGPQQIASCQPKAGPR